MSARITLALVLILAATFARADQAAQRTTYGMSLSLQGQLLDLNAPICVPAAGSYSVAYRNSIATGCSTGRSSDDFATLLFSGNAPATYTMPQSKVSTFTGSISGTTLTTPAGAVVISSVITGVGVLDNTYVTAGSGTSWTVNNSQTVASETLTQSVFPPGHGTCFKSDTSATSLLTVAATTSTISGAAGVGGATVPVNPGGEVCLQARTDNNYEAMGYLPGVASGIQFVNATQCASANGPTCTTGAVNMTGANLIVVAVTYYNGSGNITAVTDSTTANTPTLGVTRTQGSLVTNCYYDYAPTVSSSMTFSATFTGAGAFPGISVAGFSGAVSSPLDQFTTAGGSGLTSQATGSITPSQPNELVVACLGLGGATSGIAINSGYILEGVVNGGGTTNEGSALGYLIQTTAAATNPTFSWTGASDTNAGIMSFK